MVRGQFLAFLPCGGERLVAQRLLRRRHRGVDRGPAVPRHWCTHPSPPSQCRGGQQSGYPGVALGHHHPGHLLENRRHQVVGTGRPSLAQSLLQQWEGRASVTSVGLYLPGEQQGLNDPDAYAMSAEQLYRLGEELDAPGRSHPGRPQPGRGC